jgi:transposase-like protein
VGGGSSSNIAYSALQWHVDEMQLKIRGRKYWLWRAVDQDGFVLDILVQERRNEQAAVAFLRRVLMLPVASRG